MCGLENESVNPLLTTPDRPIEKAKQKLLHFYNSADDTTKLQFHTSLAAMCTRLLTHCTRLVENDSAFVAR